MAIEGGTVRAVVGAAIVLVACAGMVWNEWRAAGTADVLAIARRTVETVAVERLDPSTDGKIVHLAGDAVADGDLADPLLGEPRPALRLDRLVEVYQWREIQEGGQNDRIVRYEGVWSDRLIPSDSFRERARQNPRSFPVQPRVTFAPNTRLGAFHLDPAVLAAVPGEPILPVEATVRADGLELHLLDGQYWSGDPIKPKAGDVRVHFTQVPRGPLTVVGVSEAGHILPLVDRNGQAVPLARIGLSGPADLLRPAAASSAGEVWQGRAIMAFVMFLGVMILSRALFGLAPALLALGGGSTAGAGLVTTAIIGGGVMLLSWAWFRLL